MKTDPPLTTTNLTPDTPVQFLKGSGPQIARLLGKLGILTVRDLVYLFPRRYDDRRKLPPISQLKPDETQTFIGTLSRVQDFPTKTGKPLIRGWLSDPTGTVQLVWFNQPYLLKILKPGNVILVRGKPERNTYSGDWEIPVQECEISLSTNPEQELGIGRIIPIYPLTAGLTAYRIRQLAQTTLHPAVLQQFPNRLPRELERDEKLISLPEALYQIHFPTGLDSYRQAKTRLVFEEFFYFQLSLGFKRQFWKRGGKAPSLPTNGKLRSRYLDQLPYQLTQGQLNAIQEIDTDIQTTTPMNRLVQGDVGCGKTDVAVMAILSAIEAGSKAIIMAPTEILALQHTQKFEKALAPLGIEVILLKGGLPAKIKRHALARIEDPSPKVIIGTHALIQTNVQLGEVGLVVIDEQHRFGVAQRTHLQHKGKSPHCLFMTATPIPRSFMLTCFGDLDKSIITEMPPGRLPPTTQFAAHTQLDALYAKCRNELSQGRQAYIVYPLVEESEKLDLQAAIESWEQLKRIFPEFKVGLVHGKLSASEKESTMQQFKEGELHILVATTVIEVGIDVPNATLMMIQHAERFGLAQLHQLRGRIGRGTGHSTCYLISKPRADQHNPRIKAMLETTDGFKIAEIDLSIRGPGDMLGTRQSGLPDFKIADFIRDEARLIQARKAAFRLLRQDPFLTHPNHHLMRQELHRLYPQTQEILN